MFLRWSDILYSFTAAIFRLHPAWPPAASHRSRVADRPSHAGGWIRTSRISARSLAAPFAPTTRAQPRLAGHLPRPGSPPPPPLPALWLSRLYVSPHAARHLAPDAQPGAVINQHFNHAVNPDQPVGAALFTSGLLGRHNPLAGQHQSHHAIPIADQAQSLSFNRRPKLCARRARQSGRSPTRPAFVVVKEHHVETGAFPSHRD